MNKAPLFDEMPRRNDPPGSHVNADTLHRTAKLTARFMIVLAAIKRYPGRTAAVLGGEMFNDSENPYHIGLPHKVMARLEYHCLIYRHERHQDKRMVCYITEQGVKELAKYERANHA